jgi:iron(III) transport system permease protein
LLGTALAALVSFFEFPGRRWIEWTLVLPLAMPGYVFTLFALGLDVPGIRSTGGAVCVFTLVLYPYVYLLARSAFLSQSRTLMEAARGLGLSRARAILRVGLPLARPAILGGVALALMEALADFGTVNLLGVRTFTDAIYRVWFEAFDRDAAMQLATLLVSITLTLLVLERLARGRARYAQLAARGDLVPPVRLRGVAAAAAALVPLEFGASVRNSLLLAGMSAVMVPVVGLLLAYGARSSRSRVAAAAARSATIGYGLPGSVVAVAVIVPLGWIDHRLDGAFGTGLLLTGTVIGLFYAYLVRFLALAWGAIEASLIRIPRQLDDAARGLGADKLDVLARVHVPLVRAGLATAALLVFVEVMKELPATLLLRPLGGDTLAIAVWQATTESLFRTAALPALMIVLVGLLPVALMIRLSGRRRAGEVEASPAAAGWVDEPEAAVAA